MRQKASKTLKPKLRKKQPVPTFADREEEARVEAAEVLRLNPSFSVETAWRKENQPFKDPTAILERLYAAARKVGLK